MTDLDMVFKPSFRCFKNEKIIFSQTYELGISRVLGLGIHFWGIWVWALVWVVGESVFDLPYGIRIRLAVAFR